MEVFLQFRAPLNPFQPQIKFLAFSYYLQMERNRDGALSLNLKWSGHVCARTCVSGQICKNPPKLYGLAPRTSLIGACAIPFRPSNQLWTTVVIKNIKNFDEESLYLTSHYGMKRRRHFCLWDLFLWDLFLLFVGFVFPFCLFLSLLFVCPTSVRSLNCSLPISKVHNPWGCWQ